VAGAQCVKNAAETEQVAPLINMIAVGLLGRHVRGGAGDESRPRQAGVVGGAGQAEVRNLGVSSGR
jgi:hypothetical protein